MRCVLCILLSALFNNLYEISRINNCDENNFVLNSKCHTCVHAYRTRSSNTSLVLIFPVLTNIFRFQWNKPNAPVVVVGIFGKNKRAHGIIISLIPYAVKYSIHVTRLVYSGTHSSCVPIHMIYFYDSSYRHAAMQSSGLRSRLIFRFRRGTWRKSTVCAKC